ncbi:MAG: hypothetical protein PVJ53_07800 [Desulfobacterales bacterium]
MSNDKDKTKACCSTEHERLKEHLKHCDSPSRTDEQKHRCYRFAAWHSGRRAKKCVSET